MIIAPSAPACQVVGLLVPVGVLLVCWARRPVQHEEREQGGDQIRRPTRRRPRGDRPIRLAARRRSSAPSSRALPRSTNGSGERDVCCRSAAFVDARSSHIRHRFHRIVLARSSIRETLCSRSGVSDDQDRAGGLVGDAFGDGAERREAVQAAGADDDQIGRLRCVVECVDWVSVHPAEFARDGDECVDVEWLARVRGDRVKLAVSLMLSSPRATASASSDSREPSTPATIVPQALSCAGDEDGARCLWRVSVATLPSRIPAARLCWWLPTAIRSASASSTATSSQSVGGPCTSRDVAPGRSASSA